MSTEDSASNLKPRPEIDWAQAPFPSQRLTLGQLRQSIGCDHEELGIAVHNLALLEKEVATEAFHEAIHSAGENERHMHKVLKEGNAEELAELYIATGTVSGKQEATELIRRLEGWAAAEARKLDPTRPR